MTSSRLEDIFLNVKLNHQERSASISPYVTLLDALRERFGRLERGRVATMEPAGRLARTAEVAPHSN
jgi:hypothetical protein